MIFCFVITITSDNPKINKVVGTLFGHQRLFFFVVLLFRWELHVALGPARGGGSTEDPQQVPQGWRGGTEVVQARECTDPQGTLLHHTWGAVLCGTVAPYRYWLV